MAAEFRVVAGEKIVLEYAHTRHLAIHKKKHALEYVDKYVGESTGLVLDAGCEDGVFVSELAKRSKEVIAVDVRFTEKLKLLRELVSFSFVKADTQYLPFRGGIFELVLSSEVLDDILCPEKGISEFQRILKEGKFLILTVLWMYNVFSKLGDVSLFLLPFFSLQKRAIVGRNVKKVTHYRRIKEKGLRSKGNLYTLPPKIWVQLLINEGFCLLDCVGIGLYMPEGMPNHQFLGRTLGSYEENCKKLINIFSCCSISFL